MNESGSRRYSLVQAVTIYIVPLQLGQGCVCVGDWSKIWVSCFSLFCSCL